jgi:hypothetical protein
MKLQAQFQLTIFNFAIQMNLFASSFFLFRKISISKEHEVESSDYKVWPLNLEDRQTK